MNLSLFVEDFVQLIYFFVVLPGSTQGINFQSKESTGMTKVSWEVGLTSAIRTIQLNLHWTVSETATGESITAESTLNKLLQGTLKST